MVIQCAHVLFHGMKDRAVGPLQKSLKPSGEEYQDCMHGFIHMWVVLLTVIGRGRAPPLDQLFYHIWSGPFQNRLSLWLQVFMKCTWNFITCWQELLRILPVKSVLVSIQSVSVVRVTNVKDEVDCYAPELDIIRSMWVGRRQDANFRSTSCPVLPWNKMLQSGHSPYHAGSGIICTENQPYLCRLRFETTASRHYWDWTEMESSNPNTQQLTCFEYAALYALLTNSIEAYYCSALTTI